MTDPDPPPDPDRCATRSLAVGESQLGTASVVRSWLLLEQPGPWGVQALQDARLPDGLGPALRRATGALGVRPLLIRRPGRGASLLEPTVILAHSDPRGPWAETTRLPDAGAVLDLDLAALARGERQGLDPVRAPVLLVCTHGRHDPCCAERGRPMAAALAARFPRETWECSHLGGDRFAGNLLALPHGMYFGRLSPDEAVAAAAGYAAGGLDLRHLRGRSAYGFAVQAAEAHLLRELRLTGVDDLRLLSQARDGERVRATFATAGGRSYEVTVRTGTGVPRQLSCHDAMDAAPPVFALLGVEEVSGPRAPVTPGSPAGPGG